MHLLAMVRLHFPKHGRISLRCRVLAVHQAVASSSTASSKGTKFCFRVYVIAHTDDQCLCVDTNTFNEVRLCSMHNLVNSVGDQLDPSQAQFTTPPCSFCFDIMGMTRLYLGLKAS